MFRFRSSFAVVVLVVAFSPAARSSTTTYTDQGSFLSNVQAGYYLETFDTEGFPSYGPISSPYAFSANGFSYSANGDGGLFTVPTNGTVCLSNNSSPGSLYFTFTSGNVTAVGGNIFQDDTNGNFVAGPITATLNDGTSITIPNAQLNSFAGFTSTLPITSLTISVTSQFPTVDNLIVGQAVPEPATLTLLGIGGVGLGGYGWRRRKQAAKA